MRIHRIGQTKSVMIKRFIVKVLSLSLSLSLSLESLAHVARNSSFILSVL